MATSLSETFAENAGRVSAAVVVVDPIGVTEAVTRIAGDATDVGVGDAVHRAYPDLHCRAEVDRWPSTAISLAPLGIAATGSVVLAEETHHDRLMSLLCERHIVLLAARDIVPAVSDVVPWLRSSGHRYVTFATGPSRTSDIERVLTIGVHGPRELVIILIS